MPKASKETASESMTIEGYEGHYEHFEGATPSRSRRIAPTPTWPRSSWDSPTTVASANTGATCSRGKSSSRSRTAGKRCSWRATRTTLRPDTPRAVRRDGDRRVQPDRGPTADDRGRHPEHGGGDVGTNPQTGPATLRAGPVVGVTVFGRSRTRASGCRSARSPALPSCRRFSARGTRPGRRGSSPPAARRC